MKAAYPVILTFDTDMYVVDIPDLQIGTQGHDIADAMNMARDAIGLWGICEEDAGREIPKPSALNFIHHAKEDIVTLVDVDFTEYRRKHENRAVKKNCTIPSWLNEKAEAAGINFSGVLQEALKERLQCK